MAVLELVLAMVYTAAGSYSYDVISFFTGSIVPPEQHSLITLMELRRVVFVPRPRTPMRLMSMEMIEPLTACKIELSF